MHEMSLVSLSSPRIRKSSWQFLSPSTVRHDYGHGHRPWKLLTMLGMCPFPVASVGSEATAVECAVLCV